MPKSPRWSVSEAIAVGTALSAEATRHIERLKDRGIDQPFVKGLVQITEDLQDAATGQHGRQSSQKGTTAALEELLERAENETGAVRGAIRRKFTQREELQRKFGVGTKAGGGVVGGALSGLKTILDAAANYPSETAAAGILPRDLDSLKKLRAAIIDAERTQEAAKDKRKGGTEAKVSLQLDLESRVDDLLSAAELEFANEPAIRDGFRRSIPKKKGKGPKPAGG